MAHTDRNVATADLRGHMFRAKRQMPEDEAQQFLRKQMTAHVGTVDANGWPYVVPLVYIYEAGDLLCQCLRMCLFDMLQGRQPPNGVSSLLLRNAQVVKALQVEPELRAGAEEVGKPQSGIPGNGASAMQDLGDAVGRNLEPPRQFGSAHPQFSHLCGQVFARMNRHHCHEVLLMVINDLHVGWPGRVLRPLKADPPLLIDADTVLPLAIAFQRFQSIAGQTRQVPKINGSLQAIQFQTTGALNPREHLDPSTGREVSGSLVPVADDHVGA